MKSSLFWFVSIAALVMLTFTGCGGGGGSAATTTDPVTTTENPGTTTETPGISGTEMEYTSVTVSTAFPSSQSKISFQVLGTFSDVTSVTLDVSDGSTAYHTGSAFTDSGGVWSITATGLPVGPQLDFVAHAYNGSAVEIFSGSNLDVVLNSAGGNTITINLDAIDDGVTNVLPQITNISRPAQIEADSTVSIAFTFAGQNDEILDYLITPEANGGSFDITDSTLTMSSSGTASMNRSYTAPSYAYIGNKTHTIKVTNTQANWVQMQFNTEVVVESVNDTVVTAKFSPVIESLGGERAASSTDVNWTVSAVDDGTISTYAWTIQSGLASASWSVDNAATAVMTGYNATESGTIRVTITDNDGLITTTDFEIAVGQFPDNVVTDS